MIMQEYTTTNFRAALAIEVAGSKVVESYHEGVTGVYPPYSTPLVWVGDVAAGATIKGKTTQQSGSDANLQRGGTQIHLMGIRIA